MTSPPGKSNRPVDQDEQNLARQVENQEKGAFDLLVRKFSKRVFRQAYLIFGSVREAEDATQEVFLKAFQAMGNFKGSNLFGWLATITHNQCIDMLRKNQREVPKVHNAPEGLLFSNSPVDSFLLDEIMNHLKDVEREVVHLRIIECLEYPEIAKITGMTEGSIRNVLCRSLKKLREEALKKK